MVKSIASYDNATSGSGSVLNQVAYDYNDFKQLSADKQAHDGAVGGTTPKVSYNYEDGSDNTIRRTSLTYPDQTAVNYSYGPAGGVNDQMSLVQYLHSGTSLGVDYQYLGVGRVVICDYSCQPAVELTYYTDGGSGDAGDQYTGLDRFGRVVDQRWRKTSDDTDRVRLKYGYSRASNRVWKQNTVQTSGQDEYYTYDGLYSLSDFERGTLNAGKTGLTGTPAWEESFNYDPTGNWNGSSAAYVCKDNGYTTLSQNRNHNKANEITDITETAGTAWPTPTHDDSGNLLSAPQPNALGNAYNLTWDAWNRLVEVKNGTAFVAKYAYDGVNRRVSKLTCSERRHFYYSDQWQVVEERLGENACADRRFVWGIRFRDDLISRDNDGQRLYALHDNQSVVALIDVNGDVKERYNYDAFGAPEFLTPTWGSRTESDYGWETLYRSYRYDQETGLYQVRNRYLHPNLGRWLARDPLGLKAGVNLYGYVGNNAVNQMDSLGLADDEETAPTGTPDGGTLQVSPDGSRATYVFSDYEFYHVTQRPEEGPAVYHTFEDTRAYGYIYEDEIPAGTSVELMAAGDSGDGEIVEQNVGFWESLIPVWGSGRQSYLEFQNGRYVWGAVNAGLAVTDVATLGLGSLIKAGGKKGLKWILKRFGGRGAPTRGRSGWFNFTDDAGGLTTATGQGAPYTGNLAWANSIGLRQGYATKIDNYDAAGSWFARTDTAAHEGFHALVGRHLPSVWNAGEASIGGLRIGAPIKYLEEVGAYTVGHGAALRLHAIPFAPIEAFGSLSRAETITTLGLGAGAAAIYAAIYGATSD